MSPAGPTRASAAPARLLAASARACAAWPRLLGLILRRDRVQLPVWVVAVVAFAVATLPSLPAMAGTPEKLAAQGEMMRNPVVVMICGARYGQTYTLGILYAQMMLVWSGLLVAVMNILFVVRHSRADEDEGRLEVVRSLPTGRLASPLALAVAVVGLDVVVTVLVGLIMPVFGVESVTSAGSWVYAGALGGVGLVFAGLTLVVVQLVDSERAAILVAFGLLGVSYLVRGYGDVSSEAVARVSPLGLMQRVHAFDTNVWWPVAVLTASGLVLLVVALALARLRDLGAGLLPPPRPRAAHAPAWLRGEWGLAWRLCRGTLVAWAVAVVVLSAAYGSVMSNLASFVDSNPMYQQLLGAGGGDIVGPMVATLMIVMGVVGVIPVLATAFGLHAQERRGRLDQVLGSAVSRTRLFGAWTGLAMLAAVAMQALSAVSFWAVAASVTDPPVSAWLVARVCLNYLPVLIFFAGLGLGLVGWAERFTLVGWAYLAASFLLVYLGGLLDVPRWAQRLTPFGMVRRWPTETFSVWPVVGLLVAGVALAVAGAVGFRRRDVTAGGA